MKLIFIFALLFSFGLSTQAQLLSTTASLLETNLVENAGFENGKASWTASGGTFSVSTSSPLKDKSSATWDASATSQTLRSKAITVPAALQGQACQGDMQYSGGDTFYSLRVVDGSNVLVSSSATSTLNALAGPKIASVYFLCPSSGSVKIELLSSGDGAVIKLDDFHIRRLTNFGESTSPDVMSANIAAGVVSEETVDFINGSCTGTTTTVCNFNAGYFTVAPNCFTNSPAVSGNTLTAVTAVSASSVTLQSRNTFSNTAQGSTYGLFCQKQGADAKATQTVYRSIPRTVDNVNEFAVKVAATTAVVTEDLDVINGNCSNASNVITCTFNPGIFTVDPAINVSACPNGGGAGGGISDVWGVSTTGFTYRLLTGTNTLSANTACVKISKLGADFKTPTVQPIVINQVQTMTGGSGVNMLSALITNAGSAVISRQDGNWITTATRTGAGLVTIAIPAGTFSTAPVCLCSGGSSNRVCTVNPLATTTSVSTTVATGGSTPTDGDFTIICIGNR